MKLDERRKKIGLLGPYTFGNLGNAALQQALVQEINKTFPGAEIYGCCIDPETNRGEGGVLPFPLTRRIRDGAAAPASHGAEVESANTAGGESWKSWIKRIPLAHPAYRFVKSMWSKCKTFAEECAFLLRAYRFARESRILIVGLGGVVDDLWNGPWGDAFSLFKWAAIAKIAGTPFIFLSVGAERMDTALGRFFLRRALSLASYRSFRDEGSKRKVEAIGARGPNFVFPDLAFGLELYHGPELVASREPSRLVGVSPMAYCDPRVWPNKNPAIYEKYLRRLSKLILWLLRENYRVALVVTQIRMDRAPLRELKEMILKEASAGEAARLSEPQVQTVDQFLSFASQLDFFVSSRLHGVVLPFLVNTPVLAFSHSEKIDWLMEDMGLSDYCVNIACADPGELSKRILAIESNQESLRKSIRQKVAAYRGALQSQYDRLLR